MCSGLRCLCGSSPPTHWPIDGLSCREAELRSIDGSAWSTPMLSDLLLKEILGRLIYISITCRPDIACAVSYLAGFQADPTKLVCQAVH